MWFALSDRKYSAERVRSVTMRNPHSDWLRPQKQKNFHRLLNILCEIFCRKLSVLQDLVYMLRSVHFKDALKFWSFSNFMVLWKHVKSGKAKTWRQMINLLTIYQFSVTLNLSQQLIKVDSWLFRGSIVTNAYWLFRFIWLKNSCKQTQWLRRCNS